MKIMTKSKARALAALAEADNPDAKAEMLLNYMVQIQSQERNIDTRFLSLLNSFRLNSC